MGNKTIYDEMDIHSYFTAMIRPIMSYACVSWAGGLNKKYLVRKLIKVQRLACLMISSAFPGTPTGALEILLNITPIEKFLLAEGVRGSYRITVQGRIQDSPLGGVQFKKKCKLFLLEAGVGGPGAEPPAAGGKG